MPSRSVQPFLARALRHPLLGASGELELARELEERERAVWEHILSFGSTRPLVLKHIDDAGWLDDKLDDLGRLRRARSEEATSQAVRALAERLHGADTDRTYRSELVALLSRPGDETPELAEFRRTLRTREREVQATHSRFVAANLRLVASLAGRYVDHGTTIDDLVQEGTLGLMRAVNRFDYRRGYRFSTYAAWWIRHNIGRAIANTASPVRVPVHVMEQLRQIAAAHDKLEARLGRPPTSAEISRDLDVSAAKVDALRQQGLVSMVSLQDPIDEHGTERGQLLADPDPDEHSAFDAVAHRELVSYIEGLLEGLKPVQADILRKRFGLDGQRAHTLAELGEEYGVSRERVRQIESAALRRLRVRTRAARRSSQGGIQAAAYY